jgi:methyl-accepting chemotaxis protein
VFIFLVILSAHPVFAQKEAAGPPSTDGRPVPEYQLALNKALDTVFGVLESINSENISEQNKKEKALAFGREFRFGQENKDAMSIINLQGDLIMDPWKPGLEGKNMKGFKDTNGVPAFDRMLEIANDTGSGYLTYLWPKYDGKKPVPAVASVRIYPPFGWVVNALFYIDTIEAYETPIFMGAFVTQIPIMDDSAATPQ